MPPTRKSTPSREPSSGPSHKRVQEILRDPEVLDAWRKQIQEDEAREERNRSPHPVLWIQND